VIEVSNLSKKFGTHEALAGVSFTVGSGTIYGYLGPNGAGKTTTIRILTGLTRRGGGTVQLNGFDIERDAIKCKAQFGLVPQHTNLDAELTVEENLLIHGLLHHMAKADIVRRTTEILEYIDMEDRRKVLAKTLSGGMKRRLLIGRALMHTPSILFMDEPTVGLDPAIRRRIWGFIKKIQKDGTTIFLTTHYIEEAEFLADRVAFLDKGKIVAEDSPAKLMAAIGKWAVDFLKENHLQTIYFNSRDEARDYVLSQTNGCTVRRVNLEDAFISMTGRKIS
jgi:ABC-2 type transport system ATP-binding protein